MLRWLHKQFIPHEGNDHKPHFLRPKNAAKVLALAVFVEVVLLSQVYVFPQFKDFLAAVLPGVLVELTNNSREKINENDLSVNPLLVISAQMKAEHMAKNGYFAHESPTGESPWFWFNKSGYKFLYAGENLAVHFVDSEDIHRAWMESVTHRANILNVNFTEIGIGIAEGVYQDRSALFVVQHFGRPMGVSQQLAANSTLSSSQVVSDNPENSSTGGISVEEKIIENTIVGGPVADDFVPPVEPAIVPVELSGISGEFAGSITIPKVSLLSRIFSMPNNLTAGVYLFTLFIVTIALVLKVFVKIRIQHPQLIFAGFALFLFISGLIAMNYYLLTIPGKI